MLYEDFTEKLFEMQGLIIKDIKFVNNDKVIFAELKRKTHHCVCCSTATDTVHDYRTQIIKDVPYLGKPVKIALRKRRYRCPKCGKRFYEENTFLPKYHRMTNRLSAYIINQLSDVRSFSSVAHEVCLSVTTVIRIFDKVSYPHIHRLPEVLSIDEFKGNTNGEKYQCILTDPVNKVVLDILPERYKPYLTNYFKQYSHETRNQVRYFVSDMWRTYADISDVWFKNATPVIDKYHWIRQVIWAFENVRKQEQKKLGSELRKYFKRSRSLLIKRFETLEDEDKQAVNVMLYYSVNISRAYWYKEQFLKITSTENPEERKQMLIEWIQNAENCGIPQFEKCAGTMRNWYNGIVNSLAVSHTNGFTEGCNNKIKILKRNAYGYQNFKRFRNRILHMFSHQRQNLIQAVT